jgi:hypothetical protein
VSTVVALDEDLPRLAALADNPEFATRRREPPFVIWTGRAASVPLPLGSGRWRARLDEATDGWASAGLAYYPLWRAAALGGPLETRRGAHGDLQVRAPAGTPAVELSYGPGAPELAGLALSALALVGWLLVMRRLGTRV